MEKYESKRWDSNQLKILTSGISTERKAKLLDLPVFGTQNTLNWLKSDRTIAEKAEALDTSEELIKAAMHDLSKAEGVKE